MNRVYITCRSQTEALMAFRLLERVGVRGVLTRPPREDRGSSCAYAVRIRESELPAAKQLLNDRDFAPCKIRVLPM